MHKRLLPKHIEKQEVASSSVAVFDLRKEEVPQIVSHEPLQMRNLF